MVIMHIFHITILSKWLKGFLMYCIDVMKFYVKNWSKWRPSLKLVAILKFLTQEVQSVKFWCFFPDLRDLFAYLLYYTVSTQDRI